LTTHIAIVGLGKIARDQHVPTIGNSNAFNLVAVASPHSSLEGVDNFPDLESLLKVRRDVAAVSLCTTPQVRYQVARYALEHGLHVLLEKPPGMTVSEVIALAELARRRGVTLFASWHSRHAAAVEPARSWLSSRRIRSAHIAWKEDVRVWHPGQKWIWQAGGLGVFDPGINALSILTHLMPGAVLLQRAELSYPSNCETPIAGRLSFAGPGDIPIEMQLDFLQTGPQTWDIVVETDAGQLRLSMGGKHLTLDGRPVEVADIPEYTGLYSHFATLIRERRSDVDLAPLQLVADALLCGHRTTVEAFIE
jgi:predicted dehydrogenase